MSTAPATPAEPGRRPGGRRAAAPRRRVAGLVLAVVVPLVALLAALVLRPDVRAQERHGPDEVPLGTASLVCPGVDGADADGGAATAAAVGVASLAPAGAGGTATATTGADVGALVLGPGRVAPATTDPASTVVAAGGGLAAALLATRSVADPISAVACAPTTTDQWFTGVGAAAEHTSVLELVNPDAGTAVADVTVYSATGPVEVPALRGVAVEPGATSRFDLSQVVPRRGDLSLRVHVERGRLGVSVLDRDDQLGTATPLSDWLPAQAVPASTNVLLGLTRGIGARRLSVANPSDDEVSVSVKVISPRATFAPEGVDPVRVPPRSTAGLDLDAVLAEASKRGGVGLLVESSGPVTASLRQVTGPGGSPDLSLLAPADAFTQPTAAVLPTGRARLLLSDGAVDATVGVVATDAAGTQLATRQVSLANGTADSVPLPTGTALVTVDTGGVAVRGAVLVQRPGATVLALTDLRRTLRVPDVRPGLP